MKFFGEPEEVIVLELKAQGEKKVSAKDIAKNSQVEIVNPDLHIAEITDDAGSLEMEIFVAYGYGYSPIEGRKTLDKEVGYIEVDSIFCPIKAVKVDVENVRVGQMTDWDKLIIDIKTDGTISFKEAFKQAAEILVEQFSFVLGEINKETDLRAKTSEAEEEIASKRESKAKKSAKKKENKTE